MNQSPNHPITKSPNGASPAWSDSNLTDPHAAADKAVRVEQMFSAIAPSYDLNNRLHSMGRDQAWRRAAVKAAEVQRDDVVLDVACGTGDLAMAFAQQPAQPASRVIGVDFTYNMVAIAEKKRGTLNQLSYHVGDAMNLPIADNSVDVVSIAFGIRNVADPMAALREFYRVLKPGGRVIVLEFSLPRNPLLRAMYNGYFKHIMPRTAALIARDRSGAYKYLPRSVNTFISPTKLVAMLTHAGFRDVITQRLTFGIAVIYRAVKR